MTALTLRAPETAHLRPLVEDAIENERRLLRMGLRRTEQCLEAFETRNNLSTEEFIQAYENNERQETVEASEWIGEHRLLKRIKEKLETLKDIRFED